MQPLMLEGAGNELARLAPSTPPPTKREPARNHLGPEIDAFTARFFPAQGLKGRPLETGKTDWFTVKFGNRTPQLGPADIRRALASGVVGSVHYVIGLQFTERTYHGLIDLDAGSRYRNPATLSRLEEAARSLGLVITPCQSSYSGGWHVYLTALEAVSSSDMGRLLVALATKAGIKAEHLKDGTCEVYPNPDPTKRGKKVRLPGQAGFGYLDTLSGEPVWVCEATTPARNVSRALWVMLDQANEVEAIRQALERLPTIKAPEHPVFSQPAKRGPGRPRKTDKRSKVTPIKGQLPPADAIKLDPRLVSGYDKRSAKVGRPMFHNEANPYGLNQWKKGQRLYQSGLTEPNSRNDALRAVGYYLSFSGYTDPTERAEILLNWLMIRHNGFSNDWGNGSDPQKVEAVRAEIRRLVSWKPRSLSGEVDGLLGSLNPYQRHNKKLHDLSREKLIGALAELDAEGLPSTYDAIQAKTGLSRRTIAKHLTELGLTKRATAVSSPLDQVEEETPVTPDRDNRVNYPPQTKQTSGSEAVKKYPEKASDEVGNSYLETAHRMVDEVAAREPLFGDYFSDVVIGLVLVNHPDAQYVAARGLANVYRAFKQSIDPREVARELASLMAVG